MFAKTGMTKQEAYLKIKGEIELDAHPAQNLAIFTTNQMDDEAIQLINESLAINFPNATQYPHIAAINQRCVKMLAQIWNLPEPDSAWGTSTVGSSEAIILATVAAKLKHLELYPHKSTPSSLNIVMGQNAHTAWFKAADYLGLEAKLVPINTGRYSIEADQLKNLVDQNTILVVGVAGSHQTGFDDDLEEINNFLVNLKNTTNLNIPMHIDAALSGFIYPFTNKEYNWDFRLEQVVSINASGHKYGLVFSSIGWLCFRDKTHVPESAIYKIKYLGGEFEQFSLSFSRASSMMLAQYYNFLRYGIDGYTEIAERTLQKARWIANKLDSLGIFDIVYAASGIPIVVIQVKSGITLKLPDIGLYIQAFGWFVSVSSLDFRDTHAKIMKIVIRDHLTEEMLEDLIERFRQAIAHLSNT